MNRRAEQDLRTEKAPNTEAEITMITPRELGRLCNLPETKPTRDARKDIGNATLSLIDIEADTF